jgi:hypothetical protein
MCSTIATGRLLKRLCNPSFSLLAALRLSRRHARQRFSPAQLTLVRTFSALWMSDPLALLVLCALCGMFPQILRMSIDKV